MQQNCLLVLDQWSKSVAEEVKQARKDMKKEDIKEEDLRVHERNVRLGLGGMTAVENYSRTVANSTDPAVVTGLASVAAALVIGGGLRYDYIVPDTVSSGTLIAIQPIQDANNAILMQMAPQQATELGYLGALLATGASFTSLGQTIQANKMSQTDPTIDLKFAQNYASNILKTINSPELNEFCMTLVSHSVEGGDSLTHDQVDQLVKYVKLTLMSTSLALLYKMESSYKGAGGGVTGQEFVSLINGNVNSASPLDKQLAGLISGMLGDMSEDQASGFLTNLSSWIDSTSNSNSRLVNIQPLIDKMVVGQNPGDLEV